MGHRTSNAAIKLIKDSEGLRLVAYRDPVGVWTIGWGHTRDVYPGMFISYEVATSLLLKDVQEAERCVNREVKVPINQPMFDSLVSFVFNLGCGNFRSSTLLGLLNQGSYMAAADQFPRWRHAGGRVLPGLVRRRALEQGMFLSELQLVHNFTTEEQHEKGIYSYPVYDYPTQYYSFGVRTESGDNGTRVSS
jgi:lysozyme